mmetsp:Transcript_19092/g.24276  ORF Transcript_19092/g.24276 Transcript_19092/m.24276 type:complete len:246 (-) Transcript_19092:613-1350(-)
MSFGGHASISRERTKDVNDLQEELIKQKKLDSTRQHRLNGMDIKLKATNSKLHVLQEKYERDTKELKMQISDLKKKNKTMSNIKRRLEIAKMQHEETIRCLRNELKKYKGSRSLQSEEGEKLTDANDVFDKHQQQDDSSSASRRYTMAPGEVSRIKNAKRENQSTCISTTESVFVRVEGLPKGTKSQTLLEMCRDFGGIAQIRVMKDGITGKLKGFVTFLKSCHAKAAVEGLRAQGYEAEQVPAQ